VLETILVGLQGREKVWWYLYPFRYKTACDRHPDRHATTAIAALTHSVARLKTGPRTVFALRSPVGQPAAVAAVMRAWRWTSWQTVWPLTSVRGQNSVAVLVQ